MKTTLMVELKQEQKLLQHQPGQVPQDLFARIEQWRYDNGYVIKLN